MDLPEAEENLRVLRERFPNVEVVPISAAKGQGLEDLNTRLQSWLFSQTEENTGSMKLPLAETASCE